MAIVFGDYQDKDASKEQLVELNKTIQKVTEDTEELRFNTAIAAMMEFVNAATKWETLSAEVFQSFLLLLSPYAPHIAEELWFQSFRGSSETAAPDASTISYQTWPVVNEEMLREDTVTLPIQVCLNYTTVFHILKTSFLSLIHSELTVDVASGLTE